MKRILLPVLVICLLAIPTQAIDVTVQGSIYTEISSEPGMDLRAGTRVKLYSEMESSGFNLGKIRWIGLDHKAGELSSFMSSSYFTLSNLINWVEVQLMGFMFPQGPLAILSFGNVEVDYSPYIISLKDDQLDDFYTSYLNHRGIAVKELEFGNFNCEGFVLWGFEDPLKNVMGGKIRSDFGRTSLTGIIVDYRLRTEDAEQRIRNLFINNQGITSELGWEQTRSIELAQDLGRLGSLNLTIANMQQENYHRVSPYSAEAVIEENTLRKYEWEIPLDRNLTVLLGYRDVPPGFDPMFRDRTPEFDPETGYYLGYNPVDRYNDQQGFYTELNVESDNFNLKVNLEELKDHQKSFPGTIRGMELTLLGKLASYEFDIFSRLGTSQKWFSTGIRNTTQESFNRIIVSRPLKRNDSSIIPGFEFRQEQDTAGERQQGIFFVRYLQGDYLEFNAGLVQALSENTSSGNFFGLNYKAPNGLSVCYRHAFPQAARKQQYNYDPDYRLRPEGSIAKLSAEISF